MTCLDAAPVAAASLPPTKPAERTLVWEGGTTEISIPLEAKQGEVLDESGNTITFLRFPRGVKHGLVNCYIHLLPEEMEKLYGATIVADTKVWCKELPDGRAYLHIDYRPVKDEAPATHRLDVLWHIKALHDAGISRNDVPEGHFICETPSPLRGALILAPMDAPPWPKPQKKAEVPTMVEPLKPQGPIDTNLRNYLAAGWLIKSETDDAVILYKMENGKERLLTHHKPKKKGDKNKKKR